MALFVGYAVFNTTLNNVYEYGSTFYDSAEFATVGWRSGLRLYMGPVFGGSIYTTHASTINYIPSLFSYLWMGDRITYYALFYALVFAAMMGTAYIILLSLLPGWRGACYALLGTIALFCGQIVFDAAWEMRSDFMSPLFMLLAFRAWQLRRYRQAVLWFILNNMVREDLGIMILVPVILLTGVQYYNVRLNDRALAKEKLRWGIIISALCLVWALVTIYIQKHYFQLYDLLQDQYYDRNHPFAHLSYGLIEDRLYYLLQYAAGIWMPIFMLGVAALLFKDMELLVGALAFMPYIIGMFFSKSDMSAQFSSYKPFLFPLCVLWPAIIAYGKGVKWRRHYAVIQTIILLCGLFSMKPWFLYAMEGRWLPQPMTYHAQDYRDFGEKQLAQEGALADSTRASHAILALYPYQFQESWKSWISSMRVEDTDKVDTLIWFENDREQSLVNRVLKSGSFDIKEIPNTKIRVAHRRIALGR